MLAHYLLWIQISQQWRHWRKTYTSRLTIDKRWKGPFVVHVAEQNEFPVDELVVGYVPRLLVVEVELR